MPHRDPPMRASVLLIHDDSDLLDALTRIFEARKHEVAIAATQFTALTRLDSDAEFHVIIAGWDAAQGLGRVAYEWVLANRYGLRSRFVFVAKGSPADFVDIVHGQCLLLYSYDFEEIIRVAEATARRALSGPDVEPGEPDVGGPDRPSLLLVEDDPMQLDFMQELLSEAGFAVTGTDSVQAAVAALERSDFDVILSDWYMPNGNGGDLYDWLARNRPRLVPRCVFTSASHMPMDFARRAPGRLFFPKGQDSPALLSKLRAIAVEARADAAKRPLRA